MECINNEFRKEIFEAAKQNDKNQTINTLVDLKIPAFLKNHYIAIHGFYSDIGNAQGAY